MSTIRDTIVWCCKVQLVRTGGSCIVQWVGPVGSRMPDPSTRQNDPPLLPDHTWLVGDDAYNVCDTVLTSYGVDRELTEAVMEFNCVHSLVRVVAEMALGSLKGRFQRFITPITVNLDIVNDVVTAACILQSICIQCNYPLPSQNQSGFVDRKRWFASELGSEHFVEGVDVDVHSGLLAQARLGRVSDEEIAGGWKAVKFDVGTPTLVWRNSLCEISRGNGFQMCKLQICLG